MRQNPTPHRKQSRNPLFVTVKLKLGLSIGKTYEERIHTNNKSTNLNLMRKNLFLKCLFNGFKLLTAELKKLNFYHAALQMLLHTS